MKIAQRKFTFDEDDGDTVRGSRKTSSMINTPKFRWVEVVANTFILCRLREQRSAREPGWDRRGKQGRKDDVVGKKKKRKGMKDGEEG